MKRVIWAVVTMTALSAPAFAQSTQAQKPSTTTAPSAADVQRDRNKVKQDRADLKADQTAGKTEAVTKDQEQLKKDRAALRADMKAAGITPKHHSHAQDNTTSSTTK